MKLLKGFLSIKDRYRLVKRVLNLALTKDIPSVSLIWLEKGTTLSHTFYAEGTDKLDPVVETFIKVCSEADSEDKMNRFASNWLLRIVENYAELNGIPKDKVMVMAHPIRIGVTPEELAKEKSATYIHDSYKGIRPDLLKSVYLFARRGLEGPESPIYLTATLEHIKNAIENHHRNLTEEWDKVSLTI